MQYRSFGSRIPWRPSALGFGCMRLPVVRGGAAKIDIEESARMIRFAIDHGVNYLDTAYNYHGRECEAALGTILSDGYRDSVKIASKAPTWLIRQAGDVDRFLDQQLEHLSTDWVDVYLLHGINYEAFDRLRGLGVLESVERLRVSRRIRHFGFSFHGSLSSFMNIIDAYDGWDLCQIQYNYIDRARQAGTKGLRYAAKRGLGVVIMEPLRGGLLARGQPDAVRAFLQKASAGRSAADWAFQWLWNQPEVSTVLSGMNEMAQVIENIGSAERSGIGSLSSEEVRAVEQAGDAYLSMRPIGCTACGYCTPCKQGIQIPQLLTAYADNIMLGGTEVFWRRYSRVPRRLRPESCTGCGECGFRCPQGLDISGLMKRIEAEYADWACRSYVASP